MKSGADSVRLDHALVTFVDGGLSWYKAMRALEPLVCLQLTSAMHSPVPMANRADSLCMVQKYAELYAEDEKAFFQDYALAHKRLSELGSKFDPPEVGFCVQYRAVRDMLRFHVPCGRFSFFSWRNSQRVHTCSCLLRPSPFSVCSPSMCSFPHRA